MHFLAQMESNYDEVTDSFDSMALKSELLRGRLDRVLDCDLDVDMIQVSMPTVSSARLLSSSVRSCPSSKVDFHDQISTG